MTPVHLTERESQNLKKLLEVGHQLEQNLDSSQMATFEHRLAKFYSVFPNLESLAQIFFAKKSARSLVALLAPLERAAQTSLKDSDWLFAVRSDDRVAPANAPKSEVVFVLDNIRSAYNVGSILRTADALGIQRVFCCGYTPSIGHRLVQKTALGAEASVLVQPASDEQILHLDSVILLLKSEGYTIAGLETSAQSNPVYKTQFPQKTALVVGNERFGLSPQTLELCDLVCEIPMAGVKNSLNVGVAIAVVGYELKRQHFSQDLGRYCD